MLLHLVAHIVADVPPRTDSSETSTGDTALLISAGAVVFAAIAGATITGWFQNHKGRRWKQEDQTDQTVDTRIDAVDGRVDALGKKLDDRLEYAAEWRGRAEATLAEHGRRLDNVEAQAHFQAHGVENPPPDAVLDS